MEEKTEKPILFDSENKIMEIIWENEPIRSGDLVKLCSDNLGWKKSTTYTVLKKLGDKGVLKNEDSVVVSLVDKDRVREYASEHMVKKSFDGSLPAFVSAFLRGGNISKKEAEEIINMIETHIEE